MNIMEYFMWTENITGYIQILDFLALAMFLQW